MSQTITFPQGPVVDPQTGYVSLEWFEWFQNPQILSIILGTALDPASGGTGITSYTIGDLIYASAATTLSTLHDVATGNALISGGVGVAPSWGKIGISTHVSGLGTGVATFLGTPSSANLAAALTTKTGTGNNVFADNPTLTTPVLGVASADSITATNTTSQFIAKNGTRHAEAFLDTSYILNFGHDYSAGDNVTQFKFKSYSSGGYGTGGLRLIDGAGYTTVLNLTTNGLYLTDASGSPQHLVLGVWENPNDGSVFKNGLGWWNVASGRLNVGIDNGETLGNLNRFSVAGTNAADNSIGVSAWSADALGARIELGKSRGATIGTITIVQSGDVVGSITGYGANGSAFTNAAQISMEIDGTPGATNDMPGRIVFKTTPDGSGTLAEAFRLSQDKSATFAGDVKLVALAVSHTAPTIASGFGTSPSVVASNGTAAFTINVGTGGTASSGVITLPTAANGWKINVENLTATAANRADQRTVQTATTTTSATIQNQTVSTGAALAWTASDILIVSAVAY